MLSKTSNIAKSMAAEKLLFISEVRSDITFQGNTCRVKVFVIKKAQPV